MRLRLLLLAMCGCVGFTAAQEPPPAKPDGMGPGQHRHMPDPNKPAGEAFKNVQLLKEVPAGQFFHTMQQISASLGVRCDFCHVRGDFAADDKAEKKTARAMLKMVHAVNVDFFEGKNEVSCYTCHRGSANPVSKMPEPAPGGRAGSGGPPQGQPLP